jgi:hypothetical protein
MPLDPQEAYQLDLCGWLVLRAAVARERTAALHAALLALERTPPPPDDRALRSWTPVLDELRVLNLPDCDPAFLWPMDQPAILARVREVVPGPQRLVEAFSITRGAGPGLPLHAITTANYRCENGRPRCDMLTAVVCLTDCGPDDGPLVVFSGTHRLGVPFPFAPLDPRWPDPPHDRTIAAAARAAVPPDAAAVPWPEIPGYTEVTVQAGDIVLFVQSLWHGAKAPTSGRIRRTLYYTYSPYHFGNWHGITWSPAAFAHANAEQRRLLAGPFQGQRYPAIATDDDVPAEFTLLPDSERGPRPIGGHGAPPAPVETVAARLDRAARRGPGPFTVTGTCVVDATDGDWANHDGIWTVTVDGAATMHVARGSTGTADSRIELRADLLDDVLARRADAHGLLHCGALRIRGDVALAMQIASALIDD